MLVTLSLLTARARPPLVLVLPLRLEEARAGADTPREAAGGSGGKADDVAGAGEGAGEGAGLDMVVVVSLARVGSFIPPPCASQATGGTSILGLPCGSRDRQAVQQLLCR